MAAFELTDLPYASPELVWSCTAKNSKYIRGRLPNVGADSYFHGSTEVGNLQSYNMGKYATVRHMVTFDLTHGEDEESFTLIEIEPHSQKPASAQTTHSISASGSIKTCYEDILKITHEKRPDLDKAIWYKLKALYSTK